MKIRKEFTWAVVGCCCLTLGGCFNGQSESSSDANIELRLTKSEAELKSYMTAQYLRQYRPVIYAQEGVTENPMVTVDSEAVPFSGTNLQVAGVDEGDVWKYDGERFFVIKPEEWDYSSREYVCSTSADVTADSLPCWTEPKLVSPPEVRIVKNDKTLLSSIPLTNLKPSALYLNDKQLVVLGNRLDANSNWQNSRVDIQGFDVNNPAEPSSVLQVSLDGFRVRTRRVGDELIIVTRFSPYIEGIERFPTSNVEIENNRKRIAEVKIDDLLPSISINNVSQKLVSAQDCLLVQGNGANWGDPSLSTVTRLNLKQGTFTSQCLAGAISGIYMSQKNLYLYNQTYLDLESQVDDIAVAWGQGKTHIHKFNLEGETEYKGSNLIDGTFGWRSGANFKLGELADGSLAMVTSTEEHKLTVIKQQSDGWKPIAQIPNAENPAPIGKPDEDIYAVRFMQDRAYVVTFERIDPLYVIDLSDSANPNILGELEIPGYSDYLHPIESGLLIGIGNDADSARTGWFGIEGVKVALFDVADMNNPVQLDSKTFGHRRSYSQVSYDYHAFSGLKTDSGYRFTVPMKIYEADEQDTGTRQTNWQYSGLHLFEVQDRALVSSGAMKTDVRTEQQTELPTQVQRGLIQGDSVYHLRGADLFHAPWGHLENMSERF